MDLTGLGRNALNLELSWIQLNEFEMLIDFEWTKRTFRAVQIIVKRIFIIVSRKTCVNIEYKIKISKFSYSGTYVERTMKFLGVVTRLSSYQMPKETPFTNSYWRNKSTQWGK